MLSLRTYTNHSHTTLRGYQLKMLDDMRSSKFSLHLVPRQIGSTTILWYYASLLYANHTPFRIITVNYNMVQDIIQRFHTDSIYGIERVPINQCRMHINSIQSIRPGHIAHDGVILIDVMNYTIYSQNFEQLEMIIKESLLKGNHIHMIYSDDQIMDDHLSRLCDKFTYR